MMKNWENNGTEEIGLVTPTPGKAFLTLNMAGLIISLIVSQHVVESELVFKQTTP